MREHRANAQACAVCETILDMSYSRTHELGGFHDDAVKAMTENPSYFATWYTWKSLGLCAAIAYIAYLHGRASGK